MALFRDNRPESQTGGTQYQPDRGPGERYEKHLSIRQIRGGHLVIWDGEPAERPEADRGFQPVVSEDDGMPELVEEDRGRSEGDPDDELDALELRDVSEDQQEGREGEADRDREPEDPEGDRHAHCAPRMTGRPRGGKRRSKRPGPARAVRQE